MTSFTDLPVELLLALFTLLLPEDIPSVLATCRGVQAHAHNESIWRELAARHGVYDVPELPEWPRPFYVLYTRFVHRYGRLFGLWCSDNPYENAILRIRWEGGTSLDSSGVVAELLLLRRIPGYAGLPSDAILSHEEIDVRVPQPPQPLRMLKMSLVTNLALPESNPNDPMAHDERYVVETTCCLQTPHPTFLRRVQSPARHIFLNIPGFARSPIQQPLHPSENCPWLDHARAFSSSTFCAIPSDDASESDGTPSELEIASAIRTIGVFIYSQAPESNPSDPPSPTSFIVTCTCFDDMYNLNLPFLLGPHRWYPLNSPMPAPSIQLVPDQPPPPSSFDGLWLGSYGPNGTEVLWLQHVVAGEDVGQLRALKVTGDFHVPRGATTWYADFGAQIEYRELPASVTELLQEALQKDDEHEPAPAKWIFSGWGTISGAGFQSETTVPCFVVLESLTRILVWWSGMDRIQEYHRFES